MKTNSKKDARFLCRTKDSASSSGGFFVKWFNKTINNFAKTGMDFVVTGVFAAHTERLEKTIQAGLDNGYDVYVKTLNTDFGNIHNVPQEHLDAMKAAFVSERELKRKYKGKKRVHFGVMDGRLEV